MRGNRTLEAVEKNSPDSTGTAACPPTRDDGRPGVRSKSSSISGCGAAGRSVLERMHGFCLFKAGFRPPCGDVAAGFPPAEEELSGCHLLRRVPLTKRARLFFCGSRGLHDRRGDPPATWSSSRGARAETGRHRDRRGRREWTLKFFRKKERTSSWKANAKYPPIPPAGAARGRRGEAPSSGSTRLTQAGRIKQEKESVMNTTVIDRAGSARDFKRIRAGRLRAGLSSAPVQGFVRAERLGRDLLRRSREIDAFAGCWRRRRADWCR